MPSSDTMYPWRREFSCTPSAASITSSAASARAAPVIMFFRNSMWPGASRIEVGPQAALEEHARGVDGDALGLLVLERVEQERVLERLRVELALGPDLLELALGKRVGVGQQPADDRALAVVHVADDHDVHPLGSGRSGHARLGAERWKTTCWRSYLRERRRAGAPTPGVRLFALGMAGTLHRHPWRARSSAAAMPTRTPWSGVTGGRRAVMSQDG